ncbi:hypothetical protein LXL04_010359 [Taraxacum kok-saghyz]
MDVKGLETQDFHQLSILFYFLSVDELVRWADGVTLNREAKMVFDAVIIVAFWNIWSVRNKLVFGSEKPRKDEMFDDIRTNREVEKQRSSSLEKPPFAGSEEVVDRRGVNEPSRARAWPSSARTRSARARARFELTGPKLGSGSLRIT